MIASKIPRYLLFALILGIGVTAIMLSMFYGQYRWLAGEIVARSSEEHDSFLEASFERSMRSRMGVIADGLLLDVDIDDSGAVLRRLNRALANDEIMTGLRFTNANAHVLQSGQLPVAKLAGLVTWMDSELVLVHPLVADGETLGELAGSFGLEQLHAESLQFASEVTATEIESRRISYIWIGFGTLGLLIVCGSIIWLIVRDQTSRIRELKRQAEKLRESGFDISQADGDEGAQTVSELESHLMNWEPAEEAAKEE